MNDIQYRFDKLDQQQNSLLAKAITINFTLSNLIYGDKYEYYSAKQAITKSILKNLPKSSSNWKNFTVDFQGDQYIWIGTGQQSIEDGLQINVPQGKGYNILWIKVPDGDRLESYSINQFNSNLQWQQSIGQFTFGMNLRNSFHPDGSGADGQYNFGKWYPVHIPNNTEVIGISCLSNIYQKSCFIAGVGFGVNIWNHAFLNCGASVFGYNQNQQFISKIQFHSELWYNRLLCYIPVKENQLISFPIIANGKSKVLYFEGYKSIDDVGFTDICVKYTSNKQCCVQDSSGCPDNVRISRPKNTFIDPFSRFFQDKLFSGFQAFILPQELINNDQKWITVLFNTMKQNLPFYFGGYGTYDYPEN